MKLVVFAAGVSGLLIVLGACSGGTSEQTGSDDPDGQIDTGDPIVAIALEACLDRFIDEFGYTRVSGDTLESDGGYWSNRHDQLADFTLRSMKEEELSAADKKNGIVARYDATFDYFTRYRFVPGDSFGGAPGPAPTWAPWSERGVAATVTELADGDYDAVCWLGA